MRKWVTAATQQASIDGMTGTPSIHISATGDFADLEVMNSTNGPVLDWTTEGQIADSVHGLNG